MRGVGHQLPLRRERGLQDAEHGVEARGQARQLVRSLCVDPRRQVAGGDDVFGRVRQTSDRRNRRTGDGPTQCSRKRHSAQAHQDQQQPQPVQRSVHFVQRPGQLDGPSRSDPRRQDPDVEPGHHRVLEEGGLSPGRHGLHAVRHREPDPAFLLAGGGPPSVDQLRVAAGPSQREVGEVDAEGPGSDRVGDRLEPASEGPVYLPSQLTAHDQVDHAGGKQDRHGHSDGGYQREPGPKGHAGSRSTYPTPRIVWMSRGSPSASVLRRR